MLRAVAASAANPGTVIGPASATDGAAALFDGTTGKLLKDSKIILTVPASAATLTLASGLTNTIQGQFTVQGGTITTSQPTTITQTWNDGAVTFTADLTNITATAKAASSLSKDWQIGGTSLVAVGITSTAASPALRFGGDTTTGFYRPAADVLGAAIATVKAFSLGGAGNNISLGKSALLNVSSGTSNTAIGHQAGLAISSGAGNTLIGLNAYPNGNGSSNVYIGAASGQSASNGSNNVAVGNGALQNSTGSSGIAIGSLALQSLTSGVDNIAIGTQALQVTQTARLNIAIGSAVLGKLTNAGGGLEAQANIGIGSASMQEMTQGWENVGIGFNVLKFTTTGTVNTVAGAEAMRENLTGSNNTAFGVSALQGNTTGGFNTAIGSSAGGIAADANANVTGSNNTFLGSAAKPASTTQQDHMTVIGADATGAADNSIFIGRTSDAVRIPGVLVNTGITSDATHTDSTVCQDTTTHQFYAGSGAVGICLGTSSLRYKSDVAALTPGLNQLARLEPIRYRYLPGYGTSEHDLYGFSAEQVVDILPELVGLDAEGRPNSVDWAGLVPVIVNAIKELKAGNDVVPAVLSAMRDQQEMIEELRQAVGALRGTRH